MERQLGEVVSDIASKEKSRQASSAWDPVSTTNGTQDMMDAARAAKGKHSTFPCSAKCMEKAFRVGS